MKRQEAVSEKWGAVAVVDALGVAQYDLAQARHFVEERDGLLERLETIYRDRVENPDKLKSCKFPSGFELHVFGDTAIFSWELNPESADLESLLGGVSFFLAILVASSLAERIAWRGALSLGQYISGPSTILGPALADAAAWYADAEWIGILATPQATIRLLQYPDNVPRRWLEYDVPLKGGEHKLLAVNWPSWYWTEKDPRRAFLRDLSLFSVPRGTERKCQNSIGFFDRVEELRTKT